MKDKIKRISIFDLDGTFLDTYSSDNGKSLWKEKFGFDWPFKGWWGRAESLDSRIYFQKNPDAHIKGLDENIFEANPITKTVSSYGEEISKPDTKVILLTGRHLGVGKLVTKLLNDKGFKFDDYIYKTGNLDTADFKLEIFDKIIAEYPDLEEITIWEDRDEHVDIFNEWAWLPRLDLKITIHHITDAVN
jgi:hypothetical protein